LIVNGLHVIMKQAMKPLFKRLQRMSGDKPFQKDHLSAISSESSRDYVINQTKKIPIYQDFIPRNNRYEANRKVTKKTVAAQILHPLKGMLLTLLFAVPQISIQFPRIGGISWGGKALAQTSNSCPAGTISTTINWQPTSNIQDFLTQSLNIGGIQTTFAFSDNPPPFGTVTDTTLDQESRVNPDVYGGLPGPNLRWNIGPDKTPVPPGRSSTLTITFAQPITLASPLTLLDVDRNGARDGGRIFQDRVTVTAANGGSSVGVTGAAVGLNTRVTNRGNSVLAEGQNENAFPSSSDGNVQITLSGALNQIQILYEAGTEYGNPGQDQTIGLARINICAPTQVGSIGDRVYNDTNSNNVQDANETGISGVNVTLTGAGADGQFGTADDTTATTTTDTNGRYSFGNLPLDRQYRVAVTNPPAGLTPTQTQPNPFNLTNQNRNIDTADLGFRRSGGSIGDFVFNDRNGNGTPEEGEPGIPGVTVILRNPQGQETARTTTDERGNYNFPGLQPGDYIVEVLTPNDLSATGSTRRNVSITQPNQAIANVDFGLRGARLGAGENLRLVKRITNVFRNGNSINDPRFRTFNPDDGADDDNAPGWSQSQPVGIPRLDTPLVSGDQVEYTVYFLAEGTQLNNVRFCDAIPQGTTYNDQLAVNPPVSSDQIRVLSPLTPLPNDVTNICLDRNNSNGTVIVNLGNVPGGRIGFVRFRVRIN
jgi:uncharacterized repeat protein (TIGR01451 family)